MLKQKTFLLITTILLITAPALADLEFRDPNNISFYTGLQMNNNQIYGLGAPTASNSPVRKQDIASGYVNRSGDTLNGALNLNENPLRGIDTLEDNQGNATLDFDGNNNVYIPNGDFRLSGNNIRSVERIVGEDAASYLSTGGGNSWKIYDSANDQSIASFKEGGNVEIDNGNLTINGEGGIEIFSEGDRTPELKIYEEDAGGDDYGAIFRYSSTGNNNLKIGTLEDGFYQPILKADRPGNQLDIQRKLNLEGNAIADDTGTLTLDGNTETTGNLNLNSNNVTNTQCIGDQC